MLYSNLSNVDVPLHSLVLQHVEVVVLLNFPAQYFVHVIVIKTVTMNVQSKDMLTMIIKTMKLTIAEVVSLYIVSVKLTSCNLVCQFPRELCHVI